MKGRLQVRPPTCSTRERKKQLNRRINRMIRDILLDAYVVSCTFVIAVSLHNRQLYHPTVAYIDEASREHEANICWVQPDVDPPAAFIICSGDYRQDQPFCLSETAGEKADGHKVHFSPFAQQFMASLPRRMISCVPQWVVYLRVPPPTPAPARRASRDPIRSLLPEHYDYLVW